PKKITFYEGKVLSSCTSSEFDLSFAPALKVFEGYFQKAFGKGEGEEISLILDPSLGEGYRIKIGEKVEVAAAGNTGMNYAFSTLLQLAFAEEGKVYYPLCEIEDFPDSSWRGMMLDVARCFHEIKYLYAVADLCWLYKINRYQIHLTDDQGIRFPFDFLPKAVSKEHYTKKELSDLILYCKDRGIEIVPEIDAPGHFAAFNEAYPELFGALPTESGAETTAQAKVISGIMWGKEEAFRAMEKIFAEISDFFAASSYIHIGGDEADITRWETCPQTQTFMADKNLLSVQDLYGYMIARLCNSVLNAGKIPVVWEGFSKKCNHMIPKETLVFAWESYYQISPDLLEAGFQIINSSWQPLYVVTPKPMWDPEVILDWEKNIWDHWWPKSFAHEKPIEVPKNDLILGGQLCAWCDKMQPTRAYAERHVMLRDEFSNIRLRLPALAEKVWTSYNAPDKEKFMSVLKETDLLLGKIL
ncbi:MAG: family 20 glycosylhydrolase, partial [Clostridia bacterium]|nr:family 20 glycosylhydrolase [Clostridia bacterium]